MAGATLAKVTNVGRMTRKGLKAGRYRFSVALSRRGRRPLARKGTLRLRVQVTVRAPTGSSATLAKPVRLKRR
jgi:hypothetical protein